MVIGSQNRKYWLISRFVMYDYSRSFGFEASYDWITIMMCLFTGRCTLRRAVNSVQWIIASFRWFRTCSECVYK